MRVLGISSDGLCRLFTAVIFHQACVRRGMKRRRWSGRKHLLFHSVSFSLYSSEHHFSSSINSERELTCSHLGGGGLWKFTDPCPHPSSFTCDSLTMETFSPTVRGGLEFWKKSNYSLLPFIMPLLESHLSSKRSALCRSAGCSLGVNSRGKQAGSKLPRVWSHSFTMAAKNTAKAKNMCCANKAWQGRKMCREVS